MYFNQYTECDVGIIKDKHISGEGCVNCKAAKHLFAKQRKVSTLDSFIPQAVATQTLSATLFPSVLKSSSAPALALLLLPVCFSNASVRMGRQQVPRWAFQSHCWWCFQLKATILWFRSACHHLNSQNSLRTHEKCLNKSFLKPLMPIEIGWWVFLYPKCVCVLFWAFVLALCF